MIRRFKQARWALARLVFIFYIGFSVISLIGGFLTSPLMTWYFFGDWRFWRHWSSGLGLLPHALRIIRLMLGDARGFMFSVPLTSAPRTAPDPAVARLQEFWPHGASCGDCSKCCRPGGHACPLLDQVGLCRGYDSFYWRYFNCGRFPSVAPEIDYYDCRKWHLSPEVIKIDKSEPVSPEPFPASEWGFSGESSRQTRYEPDGRQSFQEASLPSCGSHGTKALTEGTAEEEYPDTQGQAQADSGFSKPSPRVAQTP